jgi:hypothetical protein
MKLTKAIFLAALLALSTAIHAGWVEDTIDFNHPVPFTFVATPCNSAIDNGWPDGSHDGTHLVSGFCDHDYPGNARFVMRRAYGHPFTLLGLDLYAYQVVTTSSRGGNVILNFDSQCVPEDTCETQIYNFTNDITDPLFTNVNWIDFCHEGCEHHHSTGIFDNFRVRYYVPEPAPLTLIGIALVGLAYIRRRAMTIA